MAHAASERLRLHVPGHAGGIGNPWLVELEKHLLAYDLTELPGLDDLAQPHAAIAASEALTADAYGARGALHLTGGSSLGLSALLWATLRPGDRIVLPRDAHRSVLAGLLATRADAIFVDVCRNDLGFSLGPDLDLMEATIRQARPKVVLVVDPTYDGVTVDLTRLRIAAHREGGTLIVDAAHGAHFGLPGFPDTALQRGADACVISLHKTAGALTPAAAVLLATGGPPAERVRSGVRLFGTSSPSYPILLSLESAVQLRRSGRLSDLYSMTREESARVSGPSLWRGQDPARFTLIGQDVAKSVRSLGIEPEIADPSRVLLVLPPGLQHGTLEPLVPLAREVRQGGHRPGLPILGPQDVAVTEALLATSRHLPLMQSARAIAADIVFVSPPGIPVWWPGQRITESAIEYVQAAHRDGLVVGGLGDGGTVRVV